MTMRPEARTGKEPHARAHATLVISGDSVEPEYWTRYFGVTPSSVRTKGQCYRYPSGKISTRPATTGYWAFGSKTAIRSDQLAPHLACLTETLALPRVDLRERLQAQGAEVALWCFWINDTGDRVPDVPDEIRAMMDAIGGTIEIDEYQ
ncbi:hypothetical protein AWB76_03295 [Caballeronia temeraria]|uniref:DUF4279 domain-containing protein n=2 Tax=Caballeronia temeraria TaxID=1777137 RepID=A0A158AXY7_9BURK|nr:hypothetical protein AWB76_03295 [Caballeronia temeraria]